MGNLLLYTGGPYFLLSRDDIHTRSIYNYIFRHITNAIIRSFTLMYEIGRVYLCCWRNLLRTMFYWSPNLVQFNFLKSVVIGLTWRSRAHVMWGRHCGHLISGREMIYGNRCSKNMHLMLRQFHVECLTWEVLRNWLSVWPRQLTSQWTYACEIRCEDRPQQPYKLNV
jgi:hypothetical protein